MTLSYANQARLAGLAYLVVAITGAFNLLIVPAEIIGADAATTLANAQAQTQLFRLGIAAGIVCQVFFVITPVLLYALFAPLGRIAALLMLGFALVSVPISFANIGEHMAILDLATRDGAANAIAAIAQHTDAYNRGSALGAIFWGLWLAPLGSLPRAGLSRASSASSSSSAASATSRTSSWRSLSTAIAKRSSPNTSTPQAPSANSARAFGF
jgi:hypothetical protein